jgi:hypothetical protein
MIFYCISVRNSLCKNQRLAGKSGKVPGISHSNPICRGFSYDFPIGKPHLLRILQLAMFAAE